MNGRQYRQGREVTMKMEILRVTQKLDVIDEELGTLPKDVFFSRVEDLGPRSLFITPPFRRGFYLAPRIGRVIIVRVVANKVPYLFETKLLNYISDQIPLWEVAQPDRFEKIQLRADVRLEVGLKIGLEVLASKDEKKIIRTLTRDLSAGGVQVVLPHYLPVGAMVKVNVVLDPEFSFEAQGIIIHLLPPSPPVDRHFAGIKFMEVDPATKQRIVRFIFARQAEQRLKEKERLRPY